MSSSSNPKLWLLLNESLPAEEGKALLGTVAADIQHPTDGYEPKRSDGVREHPFIDVEADLFTPKTEERTIESSSTTGSEWNAHLFSLISSCYSSSVSKRATVASARVTTYSSREPTAIFRKIRDNPEYWDKVQDLMDERGVKKLYFVRGYMVASNPTITIETSNERGGRVELTVPIIEAATGIFPVSVDPLVGDPGMALESKRAQSASQRGVVRGDQLFAIQYWTIVKKGPRRPFGRPPKSKRTHGIEHKPLVGTMFGDDPTAPPRRSGRENEDDNKVNDNDEDDDEWDFLDESGNKIEI